MTNFKNYIINNINGNVDEASFKGNIGFIEMAKFYQIANKSEIAQLEKIIKNEDWNGYKKLIYKKLGVQLQ